VMMTTGAKYVRRERQRGDAGNRRPRRHSTAKAIAAALSGKSAPSVCVCRRCHGGGSARITTRTRSFAGRPRWARARVVATPSTRCLPASRSRRRSPTTFCSRISSADRHWERRSRASRS
jgi:hypothetical protein